MFMNFEGLSDIMHKHTVDYKFILVLGANCMPKYQSECTTGGRLLINNTCSLTFLDF
jgi:hypothetical protein